MPTLVLDPRWPDMVPAHIARLIEGPVEYTPEVPEHARAWPHEEGAAWVLTTLDRPGIRVPSLDDPVHQARTVMRAARARGEWERSMTHASLVPYLREENSELIDAIENPTSDTELKKELSDVLLQVLFHSEIAAERGAFDFGDVAAAFVDKMRSRAPYFFDGSTGPVDKATQDRLWAEGKARELGQCPRAGTPK